MNIKLVKCKNCGKRIDHTDKTNYEWVDVTPADAPPNVTEERAVCPHCKSAEFVEVRP